MNEVKLICGNERLRTVERMKGLNENMSYDDEKEIDDIEFIDGMLQEDVIHKLEDLRMKLSSKILRTTGMILRRGHL